MEDFKCYNYRGKEYKTLSAMYTYGISKGYETPKDLELLKMIEGYNEDLYEMEKAYYVSDITIKGYYYDELIVSQSRFWDASESRYDYTLHAKNKKSLEIEIAQEFDKIGECGDFSVDFHMYSTRG